MDILLGTQMIAKGLDFPNVTLVGVINADTGINLPDFRATERTFQLLTQVAGRAGRGPKGGEVFIQTALPNHYAIERATEHDFVGFAERELETRREPAYPPFSRLVNVVISGLDEKATQEAAVAAADWVSGLLISRGVQAAWRSWAPRRAPSTASARGGGGTSSCAARVPRRWERCRGTSSSGTACPRSKAELRVALDRDPVALL